jgi:hypothetical protein
MLAEAARLGRVHVVQQRAYTCLKILQPGSTQRTSIWPAMKIHNIIDV